MSTAIDFSTVAATQTQFQFDVRPYFNSFKRPALPEVLDSVRLAFPDDGGVICKEGIGRFLGIYKIWSTSVPPEPTVKFSRRRNIGTEGMEVISIPLTPPEQHRERSRDGLLITIVDADLGKNHALSGRAFDSALQVYGSIELETQPQKYKGTSIHNGNRFCVIKRNNEKELPDRLLVNGVLFLIKYQGKRWACHSCKEEHVGPCPYRQMLYAARDKRKSSVIAHHVVSDSTLRYAEQSGLRADISVMSGATLGQLANAVDNDEEVERHRNVVLAAGANDTLVGEAENDQQIVKRIDFSINKFCETINKDDTRNFYLLNTCRPLPTPTRREFLAREYFSMKLRKVASYVENFDVLKRPEDEEGWADDGHPTKKYTGELLLSITSELDEDILIDPQVLTSDKIYRGVNGHYRSGCSGCTMMGLFDDGGFCTACVQKMTTQKKMLDDKLFKKVLAMALDKFPQTNKRNLSDGEENTSKKSS